MPTMTLLLGSVAAAMHPPLRQSCPLLPCFQPSRRSPPPLCQLGAGARGRLFLDQKEAMTRQAEVERELLAPHTQPMVVPKPSKKKARAMGGGGGGGFGAKAAVAPSAEEIATALRVDTLKSEGVCYVPGVLRKESAAGLLECVQDELKRAYAAVEAEPESSVARFNVPVDTFDPLRGYLLLPLRDERSVEAGEPDGVMVRALRECLSSGSVLGELFGSSLCGGGKAEWYDLVALRTEAGAARQPIHYDTPYQKACGLRDGGAVQPLGM